MKRSLVLWLVPAVLLGVLVGCGAQQEQQAAAERERAAAEQARAEAAKAKEEADKARGELERISEQKDGAPDGLKESGAGEARADPGKGDALGVADALAKPNTSPVNPTGGAAGPATLPAPTAPAAGPGGIPGYGSAGGPLPGLGVPGSGVAGSGPATYAASPGRSGATREKAQFGPGGVGGGLAGGRPPAEGKPEPGRGGDGKPADAKAAAQGQPVGGQPAAGKPADDNAQNAERYGLYRENEYRSPLVAPLSTFSADVNTASYSNVRRMLMAGALPPKDAVFLAEFVNYFPYQYARPKGEEPVEFNLEMGPCPWNRKHHLVRVGVQAQALDPKNMPARNLVFLMDTSGSMSPPNRLPLAKQAINLIVDQLTEKDRVSIVTYAGDSRIALTPTKGSEKDTIKDVMTNLRAEGSTNGEGGIQTAYKLARDTFIDGGVNRVILCTDGDFNVGVTNHGDLVRMIEEQRKSKVFLTILGFGMGNYKDETLKELANHGNGHHAYIDSLDEAKKLFVDQGGALVCVAKDVKFQVDFNPARVAAYRLVGYENRLLKDEDFRNDAKDAGDMGSGHQVTVLYEIVPVGVPIDLPGVDKSKYTIPAQVDPKAPDEWLTVKMRYKAPEAEVSKEFGKTLPGKALGQELSDDFRFAAAAASFGMLLRDSQYRGAMTYAGVLEEAQGCLKSDPGGHRREFVELVRKAKELTTPKPKAPNDGN
jgi:Ca-activated chloride channel family protein